MRYTIQLDVSDERTKLEAETGIYGTAAAEIVGS
jgi:hypothetical protein